MEHYSTRVRCTNCGKVFVKEFEKGTAITESKDPCPVCGTNSAVEAIADGSMTTIDGRQILHERR